MSSPRQSPVPTDVLLSAQEITDLLSQDTVAQRVMDKGKFPAQGQLVGVRLNLNVMKSTGKAIQTLHEGTNQLGYRRNKGFYNGEAAGYAQAVVLSGAYFNVSQTGREAIATGKNHKFAMASIDGTLVSTSVPENFEGVEISFNPKTQHLFVDSNNQAIHSAEEVVVLGNRAYARGKIVYHTELSAPTRAGDFPSNTQVLPAPHPAPKRSLVA